jgi:polyisoprenoid-binding protein YceI
MSKTYLVIGVVLVLGGLVWFSMKPKSGENINPPLVSGESKETLAGSGTFMLDTASSGLVWEGKKTLLVGYVDSGTLNLKDGKLMLSNGQISGGEFNIDMNSMATSKTGKNSGETFLTKHLKSADFFDVEKFPISKFEITAVSKSAGDDAYLYDVQGKLTIKGVTQPISFPAKIYSDGKNLIATGSVELDRTKWEIKYGSGSFFQNLGDNVIDDKFKVALNLKATPEVK